MHYASRVRHGWRSWTSVRRIADSQTFHVVSKARLVLVSFHCRSNEQMWCAGTPRLPEAIHRAAE